MDLRQTDGQVDTMPTFCNKDKFPFDIFKVTKNTEKRGQQDAINNIFK
jgi:hypothetical protein